ncbi:MAG TPA: hypothetical protein DEF00_01880 [Candidatus Taylorbacteria bacterium]|nr:MAG: hypothetical protein UY03_C0019G0005 [Parcubacteria group bacterium GW2011_GWA2_47_64]KKU95637.1 MAG: hypothetical protein UY29_C0022G0005 [Parcubacteria group bacterium GW2011_GWC2_48_17]HBV01126.1 hypothetical protein [Candidatus Taylorbacteria bacterium]
MAEDTTKKSSTLATSPAGMEERAGEQENRIYEVGYLMLPTVPEGDLPREVTTLKDAIDREKALIISEEFPKQKTLAYTMQKRSGDGYEKCINGYFGWMKFEASPKNALRIEQEFKQNKLILRYLLIKTVREHTLTAGRLRVDRRERKNVPQSPPVSVPVSEAELDKSIEKLIAE